MAIRFCGMVAVAKKTILCLFDGGMMREALEEIRRMAMEHPCFWKEAFESRDMDALAIEGGDICDWTMIAILANDALMGG